MTVRRVALAVLAGVLVTCLAGQGAAASGPGGDDGGRLLVITMPGLTWSEVASHDLPALEEVLRGSAMADLAPRGVFARSGPGDAYLTISAGARATTVRAVDGQVLALEEQSSGSEAGEIFTRRTGVVPDGEYVVLSWPALVRANADEPYDAELGLLAETLDEHGVSTHAIGNADGIDAIGASYERQVGLATADSDGVVAHGALTRELLVDEPSWPFGVRFDNEVVVERFRDAWSAAANSEEGGLVVVEMSDLARSLRYRALVDEPRYTDLRARALRSSDELLGTMLEDVDPERDTVLVVAPYNLVGDRDLTAVALRGPRIDPGYLTSASTQRSGFLTLVDIGPTILGAWGIERPVEMEGREAEVAGTDASYEERVEHLVSLNEASRFRERLLVPTTMAVIVTLVVLTAAAAVAIALRRSRRWGWLLAPIALFDLAVLPASYLARGFALEELGNGFYWTFVLLMAAVVAVAATWVGRATRRPRLGLAVVLSMIAFVLAGDVMTGSNLSLSAAFGYSPTGNSRLYGISNYSYGQLAAAVCLLAALVAARPAQWARNLAFGLLVATLVVLGVPIWGSDVGGVLAFTPTILVFAALVLRRRIRVRTVLIGAAATAVAIVVFGFLDLARPAEERAHLGRLFERVGDEGIGPLISIVERKLLANLEVSTSSLWVAAIPLAVAFWVLLTRFPGSPISALVGRVPTLRAGVVAAVVAAVLGSLANDSGLIVGGVSAMVLTASLVHLAMEPEPVPSAREADAAG